MLLFLISLLSSCALQPEEEVRQAIDQALTYLSQEKCSEAIKVLEATGHQNNNSIYLQVLASAYACRGGYNEIQFIAEDLADLNVSSPSDLFKSLTTMELSEEVVVDSEEYVSIRQGINLILNSTSAVSHAARVSKFKPRKAGDMSFQALLLSVVQLGKFLNFYGNTNSGGDKGAGTGTNTCFLNYSDSRAQTVVSGGVTGACSTNNSGHPALSLAAGNLPNARRRLCEGLMLVTNFLDILDNLDVSSSSELAKLQDIADQVNVYKVVAVAAGLGALIEMTSQSECMTYLNAPSNLDDMQYLYSLVFEVGLQ